jgi:hypothetical protein
MKLATLALYVLGVGLARLAVAALGLDPDNPLVVALAVGVGGAAGHIAARSVDRSRGARGSEGGT